MTRYLIAILILIYIMWPYDFLPDVFPGLGWLDDAGALWLLWHYFVGPAWGRFRSRKAAAARTQKNASTGTSADEEAAEASSPYTILGIEEGASQPEIRRAYRELAAKYHPDKVGHLGREFQQLAEKKFREIQAAYETLTGK